MKNLLLASFTIFVIVINMAFSYESNPTENDLPISYEQIESSQNQAAYGTGYIWYCSWIDFGGGILWPRQTSCCCRLALSQPLGQMFWCTTSGGPSSPI